MKCWVIDFLFQKSLKSLVSEIQCRFIYKRNALLDLKTHIYTPRLS